MGRPVCASTRGTAQPFAFLVSIPSRWLANDRRSLPLNAGGPPVCIPLTRIVSMKSRMLSRWRMVSVEWSPPRGLSAWTPFSITSAASGMSALTTRSPLRALFTISLSATSNPGLTCTNSTCGDAGTRTAGSALALVQGIGDADAMPGKGVWFVTRSAQVVEKERGGELAAPRCGVSAR